MENGEWRVRNGEWEGRSWKVAEVMRPQGVE